MTEVRNLRKSPGSPWSPSSGEDTSARTASFDDIGLRSRSSSIPLETS